VQIRDSAHTKAHVAIYGRTPEACRQQITHNM
jgi:hypothetical protein